MDNGLFRYERELEGGSRPALRLITTQDAPSTAPMVLCISAITWPTGEGPSAKPVLEVTDGWYRLRAEVDAPLARAVRKRVLRIGRKIVVAGARVSIQSPWTLLACANTKLTLKAQLRSQGSV
jgi:breast cancer 2 susceptibility protein